MNETVLFYHLFHHSTIGQAVVNKDLEMIYANRQLFQSLHSGIRDVKGLSFGKVFHCAELGYNNTRCGEMENCKQCGIRKCVKQILINEIVPDHVVRYSFYQEYLNTNKWLQVNGTQVRWVDEKFAALTFVDITDLQQRISDLQTKVNLDNATGTMNKASLISELRQLTETDCENSNFTVCMIDFDHFKALNDRYGHLMGDKVLEVFSDISRSHVRKNDLIGRYGGEEFIFIFFDTDQNQSLQILRRIHNELEDYFAGSVEIPVTFSAGVVHVEKLKGVLLYTDLLVDVDKMLYRAKKRGRGRAMSSMGETLFRRYEA